MRRKDRETDEAAALAVADKCEYAVLSTINEDGTPYCVPVSPVRDGRFIYFHCAKAGQKVDNLRRSPAVCLACVGDTFRPPDEFTTAYESAIIFGAATEVTEDGERIRALRLLCQRHTPAHMDAFDAEVERSLPRTGVWKISIERITGKAKKLK